MIEDCVNCGGDGEVECTECDGTGAIYCRHCRHEYDCDECDFGMVTCDDCMGTGEVEIEDDIEEDDDDA